MEFPEATGMPVERALEARADLDWSCEEAGNWGFVIPMNPESASDRDAIKDILTKRDTAIGKLGLKTGWREIRSNTLGFTAYFYLENLGPLAKSYFNSDVVGQVSFDTF